MARAKGKSGLCKSRPIKIKFKPHCIIIKHLAGDADTLIKLFSVRKTELLDTIKNRKRILIFGFAPRICYNL